MHTPTWITFGAASLGAALTFPAVAWGCSAVYSSQTTVAASDAPDCLAIVGADYSGFSPGAAARITNGCDHAAIIDCTVPQSDGLCEPLELAPGEQGTFTFVGRTISWYLSEEEQGEAQMDFTGDWSDCGGAVACAHTPGAPRGGSAPVGALLVVMGAALWGVTRRASERPSRPRR